jgi:hypothetical protein
MSRIELAVGIYHRHKPVDVIYSCSVQSESISKSLMCRSEADNKATMTGQAVVHLKRKRVSHKHIAQY